MSRLHATVLALVLCGVPHAATAAPSDFDRVVHAVESQIGVSRLPMFGLGFLFRASTWLTEPAGASGMEMAVFSPTSADGGHDSHGFSIATFEDVIARTLDKSWHLTLRTISNGDQSHALIWVRPGEKHIEVMLGVAQPNNGVLMRFRLSEARFRQWIAARRRPHGGEVSLPAWAHATRSCQSAAAASLPNARRMDDIGCRRSCRTPELRAFGSYPFDLAAINS